MSASPSNAANREQSWSSLPHKRGASTTPSRYFSTSTVRLILLCSELLWDRYSQNFLPRAAVAKDPVERMKLVVSCFISGMTCTSGNFLKPLNPILGETFQVR